MKQEILSLKKNETWDLIPLCSGISSLSYKWVYKVKKKSSGCIECCKGRLVKRKFSYMYKFDFHKTSNLIARLITIKVLISLAVGSSWILRLIDVKSTFLYVDLNKNIYILYLLALLTLLILILFINLRRLYMVWSK